jgi:hypothetical protein
MTTKTSDIELPQKLELDNDCICVVSKQKTDYFNISPITHLSENTFGVGIHDKLIIYELPVNLGHEGLKPIPHNLVRYSRDFNDGFNCHFGKITKLAVKDNLLVSGGIDATILIHDIQSKKLIHKITTHTSPIFDICISGNYIISSSMDGIINVCDIIKKENIRIIEDYQQFATDGYSLCVIDNLLLIGGYENTIKILDMQTWKCINSINIGHQGDRVCEMHVAGRFVYIRCLDGILRVDIDNLSSIPSTLNYKPTLVGSNSSGTLGPRHSKAHTEGWAYNRVPTVKRIITHDGIWCFQIIANTQIICASKDGTIRIIDINTGNYLSSIPVLNKKIYGDSYQTCMAIQDNTIIFSDRNELVITQYILFPGELSKFKSVIFGYELPTYLDNHLLACFK